MIGPQGPHGRPYLEQQIVGAADERKVVVAQHHPLLVQLGSIEGRTEVVSFDACLLKLEVLELHDHSFQGVEHPVSAQLVGRFLETNQLQALVDRENIPPLDHLHQNAGKLQPRWHALLKNGLELSILGPADVLEPDQLAHAVSRHPVLADLLELISDGPREVTQLLKRQLLDDVLD